MKRLLLPPPRSTIECDILMGFEKFAHFLLSRSLDIASDLKMVTQRSPHDSRLLWCSKMVDLSSSLNSPCHNQEGSGEGQTSHVTIAVWINTQSEGRRGKKRTRPSLNLNLLLNSHDHSSLTLTITLYQAVNLLLLATVRVLLSHFRSNSHCKIRPFAS
jgi:hypothetical protein